MFKTSYPTFSRNCQYPFPLCLHVCQCLNYVAAHSDSRDLPRRLQTLLVYRAADASPALDRVLVYHHKSMVEILEKPLVDTVVEGIREKVMQSEREVTEEQVESQGSQGSWRTAALAWSMCASWLEEVAYVRCTDSAEEQTEVVRKMADSEVRSALILMCGSVGRLVVQ